MLGDARCKIKRERCEALHEVGNASLVVVTSYAFDDDRAERPAILYAQVIYSESPS